MRTKYKSLLAPIVAVSCLSACTASNDTTRFYTLKPMESSTIEVNAVSKTFAISIESIDIPRLIDRPQIVSRKGQTEIERSEYHQWGGSIADDIENIINETLTQQLDNTPLYIQPKDSRSRPDHELYITLNRLDGELGNKALIELHWLLESAGLDATSQRGTITDSIPLTTKKYSDYVLALRQLLNRATATLAEHLNQSSKLN